MALPLNTFNFIISKNDRTMYETALTAITHLELWAFMKNFPEHEHFMFSSSPEVSRIYNKIEELGYTGHSGSSFAYTMRVMEYIAKNSIAKFREEYMKNNNIAIAQ